jgi:hypothetical protein
VLLANFSPLLHSAIIKTHHPMKITTTTLLGAATVWLGTLYGAYHFGKKQPSGQAGDGATGITTQSDGTAGSGSKSRGPSNDAGPNAAQPGAGDTLPVKQVLAKLKAVLRMGGMQNPNAMMKAMALLDKLRPEDFQAALAEAESMTDQQSKMMIHMAVLGKWAETDGAAAMKYAEEHGKSLGMMGGMGKMSVAAAWAEKDPEAVWKWYNDTKGNNEGGPMGGQMVLMSLFSNLAAKDAPAAFKRLEELEPGQKQMALAGIFQSAMFDADKRTEVLKHVDSIPDRQERQTAKQSMLSQWMMLEPDTAIDYVKSQPTEDQALLRQTAGQMLMMSNPKKGAEFMLEGVTDADRAQRYSGVVAGWAYQDPNAAGNWLKEQPQGPHLDQAKQSFVTATAERDPGSAMVWATTITEPTMREIATGHAYRAWKKQDPKLADEALKSSGLAPDQITRLQETAPTPAAPVLKIQPN